MNNGYWMILGAVFMEFGFFGAVIFGNWGTRLLAIFILGLALGFAVEWDDYKKSVASHLSQPITNTASPSNQTFP